MIDELGARMKENYESRSRFLLPRRTYTIIRVDGKAFHTYTRGCEKPFDFALMEAMDQTAAHLCRNIQGTVFAYTQSDEISVLLTDFETDQTDAWFNGNVQKMASISASLATAAFNAHAQSKGPRPDPAYFDSRVFTIPDPTEVYNYFVWRQQDASRNSIQMAAQACYGQRELQEKSCDELQEMLFQKGINWNNYPTRAKRGCFIEKKTVVMDVEYVHKKTGQLRRQENCERHVWASAEDQPVFTRDPEWLKRRIPSYR